MAHSPAAVSIKGSILGPNRMICKGKAIPIKISPRI